MPIVGCYDLHLYCDGVGCEAGPYGGRAELEVTDEFGSACRSAARRRRWKLNVREGTAVCPSCVARGATVEGPID